MAYEKRGASTTEGYGEMDLEKGHSSTSKAEAGSRGCFRNPHTAVIGGSGSGKTTSFLWTKLYRARNSMVVVDTKSILHRKFKAYLERRGFDVKKISFTKAVDSSAPFNPLDFIGRKEVKYTASGGAERTRLDYSKSDVQKLVSVLIPEGMECDKFWVYAPRCLLVALISYIFEVLPEDEISGLP